MPAEHIPPLTGRTQTIAAVMGLGTGIAAGLVGVGGGEFRIPALVQVLRLPIRPAASINLVVGLCTVLVSFLRRAGSLSWTYEQITLALAMGVASVAGSVLGCRWRRRVPVAPLKWIVALYLLIVGAWMVYESWARTEHVLMHPEGLTRQALAVGVAFVIAWVSGVLGVAGGEMRIPALLYLFALPLKEAGTISLLVSIPTVAGGAASDRWTGQLPNTALVLAVVIAIASVVGVLLGAAWLPDINAHALKGVFGVILLLATARLVVPIRSRSGTTTER